MLHQAPDVGGVIGTGEHRVCIQIAHHSTATAYPLAVEQGIAIRGAGTIEVRATSGVGGELLLSLAVGVDVDADLRPVVGVGELVATQGVGRLTPVDLRGEDVGAVGYISDVDPLAVETPPVNITTAGRNAHERTAVLGHARGTIEVHHAKAVLEANGDAGAGGGPWVQHIFCIALVMGMVVAIVGVKLTRVGLGVADEIVGLPHIADVGGEANDGAIAVAGKALLGHHAVAGGDGGPLQGVFEDGLHDFEVGTGRTERTGEVHARAGDRCEGVEVTRQGIAAAGEWTEVGDAERNGAAEAVASHPQQVLYGGIEVSFQACPAAASQVAVVVKDGAHVVGREHGHIAVVVHPQAGVAANWRSAGRQQIDADAVGLKAVPAIGLRGAVAACADGERTAARLSEPAIQEFGLDEAELTAAGLQTAIHPQLVRSVAISAADAVAIAIEDGENQTAVAGHAEGVAVGQTGGEGITLLVLQQPGGLLRVVVGDDGDDDFGLTAAAVLGETLQAGEQQGQQYEKLKGHTKQVVRNSNVANKCLPWLNRF